MLSVGWFLVAMTTGAAGQSDPSDFPPLPDFNSRVDYVAWYEKAAGEGGEDDAYAAYAAFMPNLVRSKVSEDKWPNFAGMLTGRMKEAHDADEASGPVPWDPKKHPDWEESYQRTKKVLKQFAAAAKKRHLVARSSLSRGTDSAGNLLKNANLAHLRYLRQCAAGTLEAAWRMEDGKVSAKGLIGAIETDLRVARQLDQPMFMIEAMTAAAIRRSAYENAAWGLAHGVFARKDVERLGEVLRKADAEPIEFAGTMRGEAAIMLDTLQYVFGPISPGGTPKFSANRCREATGQTMGADRLGLGSRLETDAAGTAKAILDAHVAASRKIGPRFDAAELREIQAAMNQMERLNAVTKTLFFSAASGPGHVYATNARTEAQRRATQLLVELFAYQNAKGKWPKKLSALDKAVVRRVGEDPFAGKPFRYRLTKEGPLLYSVGEDGKDDQGAHAESWGERGPGGDYVFWPIPGSGKAVAAGSLIQKQDKDLTPISAIGAGLEGKKISVAAKIKEVSSEPNPRYGRLYVITLEQDGKTIDLVYGSKLAQQLAGAENIKPGKTVRATATVVKELDAFRLELRDAKDLVVEE